ncbi:unnamed protein product [Brachionus calyciflorus]|uniref:Protein CASC3 n=1 Tax=Brachionus calyciflorus TaxID=104777 RepID=A0A814CC29_9BILA|nr:unnamed protein product [Brachionus calyciflorus]
MSAENLKNEDTKSQNESDDGQNDTQEVLTPEQKDELKQEENKSIKKDPANIPRKGYFFEHDNREDEQSDNSKKKNTNRNFNRKFRGNINEKWSHDRFDERQQQPKSKNELVRRYGYDIREENDVNSIKPIKKEVNSKQNTRKNSQDYDSDEEFNQKRDEIRRNSDSDDFGQRLADLRRRKNQPKPRENINQNFDEYKLNQNSSRSYKKNFKQKDQNSLNIENQFQKMSINDNKQKNFEQNGNYQNNSNNQIEIPKRYSSMRGQNIQSQNQQQQQQNQPAQTQRALTANHSQQQNSQQFQQQQQYQVVYQNNNNWQPSFHQNYQPQNTTSMSIAPPPGLPLSQGQNNRPYYYVPQSDYIAAQEYAAAMAASLMSNQIFYSNGTNGTQSPSLSPLTNVHGYTHLTHVQNNQFGQRQSKAIPIVNPNRVNN